MPTYPRRLKAQFSHPDRLYINGEWMESTSEQFINVHDSFTEDIFLQVPSASEYDIEKAVAAARQAFDHGPWPQMPHRERAKYLRRIATEFESRREEIAQFWVAETGLTYEAALLNANSIRSVYTRYADLSTSFAFENRHRGSAGDAYSMIVKEAVGVVGAIVPWNAPINILAYNIAPALLAGCTLVLKVSPEAPSSGYLMAEIAQKVGLPPGVINMVTADRGPSEKLVTDPRVDKISFTGSLAAGKRIGSLMAERIGRVTLELGGKSAAVILDDMDNQEVAEIIAKNTTYLSGQVCAAISRVIVPRHRHDALEKELRIAFEKISMGDPFSSTTDMGPVSSISHVERIDAHVRNAILDGQILSTGGKRPSDFPSGYFYEPTLFSNVNNASSIAQKEVFGPVICLIPADDVDHAIELANDTIFGLNNAVLTHDDNKAYAIGRRLRSGTVGQGYRRTDMSVGFGGFKQSGLGRQGGEAGLQAFLENKTLLLDGPPAHFATSK